MKGSVTKTEQKHEKESVFTPLNFWMTILSIVGMLFLGFKHFRDIDSYGEEWGKYAIAFGILGLACLFLVRARETKDIFGPIKYAKITGKTISTTLFLVLALMFVQFSVNLFTFSISNTDKALYYVFASVIEELAFRAVIIDYILDSKEDRKNWIKVLTAILFSSMMFTLVHRSYFNNLPMLIGVFFAGVFFAVMYIIERDLTANMFAHFVINVIVSLSVLGVIGL